MKKRIILVGLVLSCLTLFAACGEKEEEIPVQSIAISQPSAELVIGETLNLKVTVSPSNAFYDGITWTSTKPKVASISESGLVIALSEGNTTITAMAGGKTASCMVDVLPNYGPEAIDLGLSVKWASFNLGASKPEEYGDYYAWGETEPYYSCMDPLTWKEGKETGYSWSSYKWCMGDSKALTKYCSKPEYGYNGFTDGKTILDPEDDAAHMNLGGKWRMPTDAEWTELRENCTWTRTTLNGIYGWRVTSKKNSSFIFLPYAGAGGDPNINEADAAGNYWSSSLSNYSTAAWMVQIHSQVNRLGYGRAVGFSIRPVFK